MQAQMAEAALSPFHVAFKILGRENVNYLGKIRKPWWSFAYQGVMIDRRTDFDSLDFGRNCLNIDVIEGHGRTGPAEKVEVASPK